MAHLPSFIQDLALILCCAAVTTLLFKWLKQPVVLGYIITGLYLILPFKAQWFGNILSSDRTNI